MTNLGKRKNTIDLWKPTLYCTCGHATSSKGKILVSLVNDFSSNMWGAAKLF